MRPLCHKSRAACVYLKRGIPVTLLPSIVPGTARIKRMFSVFMCGNSRERSTALETKVQFGQKLIIPNLEDRKSLCKRVNVLAFDREHTGQSKLVYGEGAWVMPS